jgi:putative PIN family toxin of toxin-antitoxin system
MIIVLDTSVIISALLSPSGPPAEIFNEWELDKFDVTISPPLINEIERVLKYPRIAKYLNWSQEKISSFLRQYASAAILVEPQLELEVIQEDVTDNRVLECAIAGNASYIVTGDKHLLNIEEYQGIVVLSPAGFLAFLQSGEKK